MYKYLEIIDKKSQQAVERFDVTIKSERSIDQLEDGLNINLNHKEYFTKINNSEIPLPTKLGTKA